MATEGYWDEPRIKREQSYFSQWRPTLDSLISEDDPVRLFDEVLAQVDWSSWESHYNGQRGQPPIHPRTVASVILYGLYRNIRSTRKLEEACYYRFDFIWLAEGRRMDHSTLSKFRTKFREPLKDLFKQIGRLAMTLGMIRLGEVAFDGTRVKASNSRFATRTAKTLEQKLAALDELFDHLVDELNTADTRDDKLGSTSRLPAELADIEARRELVRVALERAQAEDEARRKQGVDPEKNPVQIPITDPDSRVMPNKEGGYAPNYTPVLVTDGERGFILDCDVLNEVNESTAIFPMLDGIKATFGQLPESFLTDGGNVSGPIQHEMEERGVAFYAPVASAQPQPDDPAFREDPHEAVPESEWANLPRNNQGKLDRSCFTYVSEEDAYYCPQGHKLPYEKNKGTRIVTGEQVEHRLYRCANCEGCPLAPVCLSATCTRGRTITRDQHAEVRERTAARMRTAEARSLYKRRPQIGETPFGILKRIMGIRQFLLRGLEKVKTEWLWAVTAFNIKKLVTEIGKLRAQLAQTAAA